MLTVGIIYNLKPPNCRSDRYLEWDEYATIKAVKDAISERANVIMIEADEQIWDKLRENREKIDIVFNIAEGTKGSWREAFVPMLLEELGIPYTGSDPSTLLLALDKERCKQILSYYKLRYPQYKVFTEVPELTEEDLLPLEFPLIVKPAWEGSSKGILNSSLVGDVKRCQNEIARIIKDYNQPAIVEEFISGREFTVGIIGNGNNLIVLPIVEINLKALPKGASPIYSYEAKWIWDVPESPLNIFQCPAQIPSNIASAIKRIAKMAYKALNCRDWCRIDLRLDDQQRPYILELNPIPGILPNPEQNSCLPKAARVYGWTYSELINNVLSIACKRYGIKYGEEIYSGNV